MLDSLSWKGYTEDPCQHIIFHLFPLRDSSVESEVTLVALPLCPASIRCLFFHEKHSEWRLRRLFGRESVWCTKCMDLSVDFHNCKTTGNSGVRYLGKNLLIREAAEYRSVISSLSFSLTQKWPLKLLKHPSILLVSLYHSMSPLRTLRLILVS